MFWQWRKQRRPQGTPFDFHLNAIRLRKFYGFVSLVRSCTAAAASCTIADGWYKQEEQNKDDQEHYGPLRVSTKSSVHGSPSSPFFMMVYIADSVSQERVAAVQKRVINSLPRSLRHNQLLVQARRTERR